MNKIINPIFCEQKLANINIITIYSLEPFWGIFVFAYTILSRVCEFNTILKQTEEGKGENIFLVKFSLTSLN